MKVFLSSTAQDLDAYRKVADDTILRLAQESIVMERFGPKPNAPVEECERLARECDVTVCIVAHRYGSVPDKGKGSFTEREVKAAKNAGKDVLVWIVDGDFSWTEKKEQDILADENVINDPASVEKVREGVAGLIEFKAWLRKTFTPETFTTPDDLGKKVAITLGAYLRGQATSSLPQDRISIARLPTSGAELFGREKELQLLDDAWVNPNTNIVSFVAWGGVGKTALVNHWLKKRMARDNYRGAERVYGWSFFSQGTSERAASADLFIDQALRWFGDKDPNAGSPWDKGERLAGYLRQTRTLLILDGLEPLQHPPGPQEGKLKDAAMQALLVELAAHQPGLCVISTRERVGDLIEFENSTVNQHDLDKLSPQAGAQILRSFKVDGDEEELEVASTEVGGHAFSLTLLGSYLNEVLDSDIRRRKEIENLFDDTRFGHAAQRMIVAYEKWLGEGIELSILRLLGFFDRPADVASINALREPPAIPELTEPLQLFQAREWNQALAKLRRIKLLGEAWPAEPGTLDAHPLLREHFKQQLKRTIPDAWREGNSRLYDHLTKTAKQLPETIEEMAPLYCAMAHGAAADRYADAMDDVYFERMQRKDLYFNLRILGAFGADLASLAGMFETPWHQPISTLPIAAKSYVLHEVGADLRALGRLREAAEPMRAALDMRIANRAFSSAGATALNLAELSMTIGQVSEALILAEQSVQLSTQSGADFPMVISLAVSAYALHQAGNYDKAAEMFLESETVQKNSEPDYQMLYSVRGFRYCDLLLDRGQKDVVKERAKKILEWHLPSKWSLDIALYKLLLGICMISDEDRNSMTEATGLIESAVQGLRIAGQIDNLPLGLLKRAELYRLKHEYNLASHDLEDIYRISTRSGMGLHLADYHLESARLRLAQGDKEKAREHCRTAKEMIDRMGYHRRDKEVTEIESQFG